MKVIAETMTAWTAELIPAYDPHSCRDFCACLFLPNEPWRLPGDIRSQRDRRPSCQGKERKKLYGQVPVTRMCFRPWLKEAGEDLSTACTLLAEGDLARASIEARVVRQLQRSETSFHRDFASVERCQVALLEPSATQLGHPTLMNTPTAATVVPAQSTNALPP